MSEHHSRSWLEERAERLAQPQLIDATDAALKRLWSKFDNDELSRLARGLELGPAMRSREQSEALAKLTETLDQWGNAL